MPIVSTMKVTYLDGGTIAIINVDDFDSTQHVRWEEPEAASPPPAEPEEPTQKKPQFFEIAEGESEGRRGRPFRQPLGWTPESPVIPKEKAKNV